MLDEKDTIEYIRRAKSGDQEAKQALVDGNVSLIKCIVKRYLGKGVEYDDLFQLACMGFLKAIAGFDESFGVRFSTYAVPMIAGRRFGEGFACHEADGERNEYVRFGIYVGARSPARD